MKLAWRCVKALLTGGQTYFLRSPSMSSFFEDLQEVRPTEIVLPPRVCTLLYENFVEDLECITAVKRQLRHPQTAQGEGAQLLCAY